MEWMGLVRPFCWAVVKVLVACWVTLSNDYAIGSTLLCCVLRQKYCCAFALCACDKGCYEMDVYVYPGERYCGIVVMVM